jgi:hypothetical protein
MLYLGLGHTLQEVEEAEHIVAIVMEGFLDGFSDCFEGGEMDDALDIGVFEEYAAQAFQITEVGGVVKDLLCGDLFDSVEYRCPGVGKVVHRDGGIAVIQ